jgi:hypothetical protein
MQEAGELDSTTVLDTNREVPITEREIGKQEFEAFVKDTYRHLINCERKRMGGSSTLEVFCRLDIGLFSRDDGSLGYFVNEVERTLTTGLWIRGLDVNYRVFAVTLAEALVRWADNLLQHS